MSTSAPKMPALLDIHQSAHILGVSDRTLHKLTKSGQIASIRVGRSLRYAEEDLQSYINSQRTGGAKSEPVAV